MECKRGMNMTGTDRIKAKIMDESRAAADIQLDAATREADEIIAAAEKEAMLAAQKARLAAEEEAAHQNKRMLAVASLEERKSVLKVRQDMVELAFRKAMDKLAALPDREYGAFLKSYAIGAVREGAGEILLNETDKKRLGQAFVKDLNDSLAKAGKKSTLSLAVDALKAKGGFVLRYGDMEINSTLEIMMNQIKPKLEVQVADILFNNGNA